MLDLHLYLSVEDIWIEIFVVIVVIVVVSSTTQKPLAADRSPFHPVGAFGRFAVLARDHQQRGHEGFLDVRETEPGREGRDGAGEFRGEVDLRVVGEFGAPVLAVAHALGEIRVREEVFAVEAGGPLGDGRVQAVEVVGAADHEDAVVALEPVHFVQEVAAHGVADDAVEVLEHEEARRRLPRFREDRLDRPLRPVVAGQRADVERGDRIRAVGEGVHHGFDGDGFSVSRGPRSR